MKAWNEVTHFAGFDWAKDHHDVLVLDGTGKITSEFRFDFLRPSATSARYAAAERALVAGVLERIST